MHCTLPSAQISYKTPNQPPFMNPSPIKTIIKSIVTSRPPTSTLPTQIFHKTTEFLTQKTQETEKISIKKK